MSRLSLARGATSMPREHQADHRSHTHQAHGAGAMASVTALADHRATVADRPVVLEFCGHCGSREVMVLASRRRREHPVAVKCSSCGWVLSLVALRAIRDRMRLLSAEEIVRQLRVVAGRPERPSGGAR